MTDEYQHLGYYSDWVNEANRQADLYPLAAPGVETQRLVRQTLGFNKLPELAVDVRSELAWEQDGLAGEQVSWSVGYGPRTQAWIFKPAGVQGRLPGILALHDHGGYKFYGKEKIADGPQGRATGLAAFRGCYGGRAYVNALAHEGYTVLVHDTFLWGSRRFGLETMLKSVGADVAASQSGWWPAPDDQTFEIRQYNVACGHFEHVAAKYANLLGTNISGVVSHEDRIALNYLLARPDVDAEHVGCLGLSGGGNRAVLLQASHDRLKAAVIVGLMSTYPGLIDHNIATHTWMMFPSLWARYGDWPDIAACRAPSPILVQYDSEDELFTLEGMQAAHRRLQELYRMAGTPQGYTGQFYPGGHKFDLEMQSAAFAWLKAQLVG
jgi:dienelactone hydrolase